MSIEDLAGDVMAEKAEYWTDKRSVLVRCEGALVDRLDRLCSEVGWTRNRLIVGLLEHGSDDLARALAKADGGLDQSKYAALTFGGALPGRPGATESDSRER